MSGPRWDQRRPNYAAWSVVGALGSSAWLIAIYALPAWRFLATWLDSLQYGTPPTNQVVSHVVLGFGYLILGSTGLYLIWVRSRVRPIVFWFRTAVAIVTAASGVIVARTPAPSGAPASVNYTVWAYVMTLVAVSAALWGVLSALAELRVRGELGPRPLS